MSDMSHTAPAIACPSAPDGRCAFGPPEPFADKSGKLGDVSLVRCLHCGLGVSLPQLADVAFLYEGRGSQDFQPTSTGAARVIKRLAFTRQARTLLKQVGATPRSVLDFGCGSGLFTRCLGDLLPGAKVVGSDFHPEPPPDLADRPYVPNRALEDVDGSFDLVLMMHVLEHDDDPVALLRRVAALGHSGSSFVIEVPNIDCVWAPFFGRAWDAWYLPFHRMHFSRASLRSVIERSGLVVDGEYNACVPSMGRTLANLIGARNTLPFLLAGILLHPLQLLGEKLSARPSALRIVARKP